MLVAAAFGSAVTVGCQTRPRQRSKIRPLFILGLGHTIHGLGQPGWTAVLTHGSNSTPRSGYHVASPKAAG